MGRVGILVSFVRRLVGATNSSDAMFDRGGGDNRTGQHFAPPGDDSQPLPGDYVAALSQAPTGRDSVVGYVDPVSTPVAGPGEVRRYARDPDTGDTMVSFWLKATGEAVIANDNGSITLQPDGSVNINGVIIAANGDVTIPNSLNLAGLEIAGHTHLAGTPPGNTGPNQ